jgi:methylmalonyl-CoA mutase
MLKKTIQDILKESFPKSNKEDWKRAAMLELDGKEPFEALRWTTEEDLVFFPYYTAADLHSLDYLKNFQLPSSGSVYAGSRAWVNLPEIVVTHLLTANRTALHHLSLGADGILFDLRGTNEEIQPLLDKIEWPYCHLAFLMGEKNVATIIRHVQTSQYASGSLSGAFFWDTLPENSESVMQAFASQQKIQALGLIIKPATVIDELVSALTGGVTVFDELTEKGVSPVSVAQNLALSVPLGKDFLLEIAKLKALRLLWFQIVRAYGVTDYRPENLNIHVRSAAWRDERYQPHGNMLKGTTAAIAAILGGCNALTVEQEDESNSIMNRIARNTSTILREESHLHNVADPLAGAYAIDNIVHTIAEKAWEKFLQQVRPSSI